MSETQNDIQRQVMQLARGADSIYTQQELETRLKDAAASGRQLRVKLGLDPTAPDIHLGHTVVLRKMRQFQDLGHKAVMIIGDYTARIGDPTGQNKTRPVLDPEQIEANAQTYFDQAGKVLDISPEKFEVRYNSEWLASLNLAEIIQLCGQMTVARMMERDTFELRFKAGVPIGVHEFLYPLVQGYDSVAIEADVELGGTDQTFNNLVGRQLQANAGQASQIVLIMPILVGLDGVEKMSKSKGNYIGVTDEANDMFGKVMSIPDSLMANYFTLLTGVDRGEIAHLVDADKTHPRKAKAELGRRIVERFYGADAAKAAADEFDRVFAERKVPTDMPEIRLSGPTATAVELITTLDPTKSKGEARRLIKQNAVSLDGEKVPAGDSDVALELRDGQVLKAGKRLFGRIRFG